MVLPFPPPVLIQGQIIWILQLSGRRMTAPSTWVHLPRIATSPVSPPTKLFQETPTKQPPDTAVEQTANKETTRLPPSKMNLYFTFPLWNSYLNFRAV